MHRAALLLSLGLALAGCRIEPVPTGETVAADSAATDSAAAESAALPEIPVARGDTARVGPDEAGRAARPSGRATEAPSGLLVPVVGVRPRDLVDTFEAARSEGRTHNALDILAPRGTPVVASAPGEVARLFESEKGGLTVYVVGDDRRTVYYYAHLDAWAPGLEAGQALRAGDAVGTVGDTGNAAPGNTHLHFGVWRVADPAAFWDGEPLNPYDLLTAE